MDDQVLVYRGADQPDMSVINPESDVWQHIQVLGTFRTRERVMNAVLLYRYHWTISP
jgi:hypothetical protein